MFHRYVILAALVIQSSVSMALSETSGALFSISGMQTSEVYVTAVDSTVRAYEIGNPNELGLAQSNSDVADQRAQLFIPEGTSITVENMATNEDQEMLYQIKINDTLTAWLSEKSLLKLEVYLPSAQAGLSMITPVKGRITSRQGMRKHPILGRRKYHAGTDIAAPSGTPVKAAASGRVTWAARRGGYGNLVMIQHAGGVQTRYAHLSRILCDAGSTVQQGQVIGKVGSTGRSTGPHLHFEKRGA